MKRSRLSLLSSHIRRVHVGGAAEPFAYALDLLDSRLRAWSYRNRVAAKVRRERASRSFTRAVTALGEQPQFERLRRQPLGFYDVGARGGPPISAYRFGSVLKVVMCEPDPWETRHLRAVKGFRETIVEVRLIGAQGGRALLNLTRKPGGSSVLQPGARTNDRHEVIRQRSTEMITLDQLVDETGIPCDVLKVDVQGFDFEVLKGCSQRPHCIRVEAASYESYRHQHMAADICTLLEARGYSLISDTSVLRQTKKEQDLLFSWTGGSEANLLATVDPTAWIIAHAVLDALGAPGFRIPSAWGAQTEGLRDLASSA